MPLCVSREKRCVSTSPVQAVAFGIGGKGRTDFPFRPGPPPLAVTPGISRSPHAHRRNIPYQPHHQSNRAQAVGNRRIRHNLPHAAESHRYRVFRRVYKLPVSLFILRCNDPEDRHDQPCTYEDIPREKIRFNQPGSGCGLWYWGKGPNRFSISARASSIGSDTRGLANAILFSYDSFVEESRVVR